MQDILVDVVIIHSKCCFESLRRFCFACCVCIYIYICMYVYTYVCVYIYIEYIRGCCDHSFEMLLRESEAVLFCLLCVYIYLYMYVCRYVCLCTLQYVHIFTQGIFVDVEVIHAKNPNIVYVCVCAREYVCVCMHTNTHK